MVRDGEASCAIECGSCVPLDVVGPIAPGEAAEAVGDGDGAMLAVVVGASEIVSKRLVVSPATLNGDPATVALVVDCACSSITGTVLTRVVDQGFVDDKGGKLDNGA